MKIGILLTGRPPEDLAAVTDDYPKKFQALLDGHGFSFQTWAALDGDIPQAREADGWLITGSRHGVYEDHAWIPPLEQLIRDIVAAERPLVGVCFGHQIIAQALGGRVAKFDGGWAIGPQTYDFPDGQKTIQAWHQDQVLDAPEGTQTVASNDFCKHAALLYPGQAYTVQSHPEFDDGFVQGLIDTRAKGVVPDDVQAAAQARMGIALDSPDLGQQFARFFLERKIA
ncbi:MAG: type 1 glutamine amidotransferase [Pelagimonas sp.]|jgi:GMP synthase (glutamine-hydrolysing)|nr:type 1 glutamine amidotransferase [Pelagimonas sp.]